MGAACLDSGNCSPPPPPASQRLMSLPALERCHLLGDQVSSPAWPGSLPWVPADKSLSWLCVNHLPLPHAPLSGWSSPLYPGLQPIQPGQGLTPLLREPWHGAQCSRIQLEGGTKKVSVTDQGSSLPPFLGVLGRCVEAQVRERFN